jgi:Putative prokaryotic signal transducing protein
MSIISDLLHRLGGKRPDASPTRLPSPDELALVARPNGEPDAQLQREILEQNGIRAMVKNRDPASAQAGGMGPTWAYELWVLRKDLRRAHELLDVDPSGDE